MAPGTGGAGSGRVVPTRLRVPPELFGSVEPLLPSLREDGVAVWVLGAGPYPPGVVAMQELLDAASEELEPEDVWEPQDMNDTCLYIFTSGTTGGAGPGGLGEGSG